MTEMDAYKTIYSIDADSGSLWNVGLLCAIGVTILFIFNLRRSRTDPRGAERGVSTFVCIVIGAVGMIVWFGYLDGIVRHRRLMHMLQNGDVAVVEGRVEVKTRASAWTHDSEHFTVDGVHFKYSPNNLSRGGLRNAGIVDDGMYVRVSHVESVIVKLEYDPNAERDQ